MQRVVLTVRANPAQFQETLQDISAEWARKMEMFFDGVQTGAAYYLLQIIAACSQPVVHEERDSGRGEADRSIGNLQTSNIREPPE